MSTSANGRLGVSLRGSVLPGVCLLALASCRSNPEVEHPGSAGLGNAAPEALQPVVAQAAPGALTIGRSGEQRPISAYFLGDGPEVILFLATIHGNEAAGTILLERLALELSGDPEKLQGKRAIIVPIVNPDGYAAGQRSNANGVDLNRNFPAANQADARRGGERPLSESEARVIAGLVDLHKPWRVVSIHQPLNCVDFDGPAAELAAALSEACDLPVKKLGGRPGSLGTWLGQERGIPTITLELPRRVDADPGAHWGRYGPALLRFLAGS